MIHTAMRAIVGAVSLSTSASMAADMTAIENAAEADAFLAQDAPLECERFGLLALALDAAVERDREGLAAIEAIEATRRAHGRSHGLEWAAEQLWIDATRLRQAAGLMRAMAGREAEVRALLASPPASP